MASDVTQRYRPGVFADPNLDLAMKTIYDQVYSLNDAALLAVDEVDAANDQALASGVTTVTGVQNGIATGLATVTNVVVSLDSGGSPLNEWVTANPNARQAGKIDIQVSKPTASGNNTPIASTTARTVRWMAFGNRVTTNT